MEHGSHGFDAGDRSIAVNFSDNDEAVVMELVQNIMDQMKVGHGSDKGNYIQNEGKAMLQVLSTVFAAMAVRREKEIINREWSLLGSARQDLRLMENQIRELWEVQQRNISERKQDLEKQEVLMERKKTDVDEWAREKENKIYLMVKEARLRIEKLDEEYRTGIYRQIPSRIKVENFFKYRVPDVAKKIRMVSSEPEPVWAVIFGAAFVVFMYLGVTGAMFASGLLMWPLLAKPIVNDLERMWAIYYAGTIVAKILFGDGVCMFVSGLLIGILGNENLPKQFGELPCWLILGTITLSLMLVFRPLVSVLVVGVLLVFYEAHLSICPSRKRTAKK